MNCTRLNAWLVLDGWRIIIHSPKSSGLYPFVSWSKPPFKCTKPFCWYTFAAYGEPYIIIRKKKKHIHELRYRHAKEYQTKQKKLKPSKNSQTKQKRSNRQPQPQPQLQAQTRVNLHTRKQKRSALPFLRPTSHLNDSYPNLAILCLPKLLIDHVFGILDLWSLVQTNLRYNVPFFALD